VVSACWRPNRRVFEHGLRGSIPFRAMHARLSTRLRATSYGVGAFSRPRSSRCLDSKKETLLFAHVCFGRPVLDASSSRLGLSSEPKPRASTCRAATPLSALDADPPRHSVSRALDEPSPKPFRPLTSLCRSKAPTRRFHLSRLSAPALHVSHDVQCRLCTSKPESFHRPPSVRG